MVKTEVGWNPSIPKTQQISKPQWAQSWPAHMRSHFKKKSWANYRYMNGLWQCRLPPIHKWAHNLNSFLFWVTFKFIPSQFWAAPTKQR